MLFTWKYLENQGIVTDSCLPYTSDKGKVGDCHDKCTNGEEWVKYSCDTATVKATTIEEI